jgi:uncharacterized protein with von Willebrand factor type A (vWA) domain
MPSLPIPIDQAIVELCRYARANGLSTGVKESLDALRAAEAIGVTDREILKTGLRAVLCSSHNEWEMFDDLFDDFWNSRHRHTITSNKRAKNTSSLDRPNSRDRKTVMLLASQNKAEIPESAGAKAVLGATAIERLKRADFSDIAFSDLPDLERVAMRLLRQMSLRLSRRLKRSNLRGQVDLRRTIRLNISRNGDPIELGFRHRQLQQLRLLVLLDVSGSMNPYSLFLLRFAYALQKYFKRVDTFLFSTGLTDITAVLRSRSLQDVLRALSQERAGWSGGTMIGDSLRQLSAEHRGLLTRNTLFLVLSDGWETGSAEMLATELAGIKQRVRKILWLNPLLGMKGYEPITRGMSAALPYIDVFAPAHNLESLLLLEQHLRRA